MTRSQAVALGLNAVSAMITFTLVTQTDVSVAPIVRYFLGVTAVGITVVLTALRIQPAPPLVVPDGGKPIGGGE